MIRRIVLTLLVGFVVTVAVVATFLAYRTSVIAAEVARDYPPVGAFVEAAGERVHYVDLGDKGAPPERTIVMLHGASANLRDLMSSIGEPLAKTGRVILIDRPGHGWTSRRAGRADAQLARQAEIVMATLSAIHVDRAVMLGHSWAGALALRIGLDYPSRTVGLVLIAPVSHPWPGGVGWLNDVATLPLIGPLFTHTLVAPIGMKSFTQAVRFVFAPAEPPPDYVTKTALPLLVRPADFRANAEDLEDLKPQIIEQSKRYGAMKMPVLILVGTTDNVVSPVIHSAALERDIAGAKRIELDGAGHVPIRSRTAEVIEAITTFLGALPAASR